MRVDVLDKSLAVSMCINNHYLHRRPPISYSFGLWSAEGIKGVITYGVPASRHLQKSVCPSNPDLCIELNRVWVCDSMPRNTESWFISRTLKKLDPLIVCSYADTTQGHVGYIYRATNWYYFGFTDMERKTPRFDYIVPDGKHTRDAFRGADRNYTRVRRKPKYRYWTTTGTRRDKRRLKKLCGWECLDWNIVSP